MKQVKCDFCEEQIKGEDFDGWMEEAHKHYGANHADKLAGVTEEGKKAWTEKAKAQFEAAPVME